MTQQSHVANDIEIFQLIAELCTFHFIYLSIVHPNKYDFEIRTPILGYETHSTGTLITNELIQLLHFKHFAVLFCLYHRNSIELQYFAFRKMSTGVELNYKFCFNEIMSSDKNSLAQFQPIPISIRSCVCVCVIFFWSHVWHSNCLC